MAHNELETSDEPLQLTPEMGFPRFHVDSVTERVDFDEAFLEKFQTLKRSIGKVATASQPSLFVAQPLGDFGPTHY